ncbi:MAG: dephospho-CoA kinase [Ectothiorhodospiraceae bacterium]|nr:dephospho-CoA kinase [Ectothiorhodospiraceae bacterium]MCH8502788.1 dephospho-CoA kinase [Ectothiorhodospiraceae bacterium]
MSRRVYTVGLTGGIASGKTAVSDRLKALGADIIDADVAARAVVEPGEPALEELTREFGPTILQADGTLDRAALRRQVFGDTAARKRLEAILHPKIREWLMQRLEASPGPYAVLVVPLLVEGGLVDLVDRVLVVDVPETVQLERLVRRDGSDEQQARAILAAQAGRDQRLARADDVLDNTAPLEDLDARVEELHRRYLALGGW